MQILRETFKEPLRKGKSPKDVLVKAKQQLQMNNTMATA